MIHVALMHFLFRNDLIQPDVPGQFSLKDLRKNGFLAERFFDTFINYDRFQVHEAHQEGSIRQQKLHEQKQWQENETPYDPAILKDDLGFPVLWYVFEHTKNTHSF